MSSELFVEVRCEELPPSMVRPALDGLRDGLVKLLDGMPIGAVRVFATPRRLAVAIADVADGKPMVKRLITGPPADRAQVDGQWTPAATGFAKGKGKDVSDIQIVDSPKGKLIAIEVDEGGEKTFTLLANGLADVIAKILFHKSMEWGRGGVRFGRPLQGIAALFGGEVIPGKLGDVAFGRETEAHRLAKDKHFTFSSADEWLAGLRKRWVEPDLVARSATIRGMLDRAAESLGAERIEDAALEEQVLHLVECPTQMIGSFEADLLHLPPRLLVESMKVHQRYFPVFIAGKLTNKFVVISNNPEGDAELIASGYARVLRARFFDARFFLAEDKKKKLGEFAAGLDRMRWIKGLGTMADKQRRVAALAELLAPKVGADEGAVRTAGGLCKADLLTQMVGEFPELQGHIGKLYALGQGEPEAAASAIEEHYHPRFAGDAVPWTPEGAALGLADRLDTLVGCFGIGLVPKGGGDPQGLRRAAIGVVNTLIQRGLFTELRALFADAVKEFHQDAAGRPGFEAWNKERGTAPIPKDAEGLVESLVDFALARWRAQVTGEGVPADYADAIAESWESEGGRLERRPLAAQQKLTALRELAASADFDSFVALLKRVSNICKAAAAPPSGDLGGTTGAEVPLEAAIEQVRSSVDGRIQARDYAGILKDLLTLREPIATFFDSVLVNDANDPIGTARRLNLLSRVASLSLWVADFSRISTR